MTDRLARNRALWTDVNDRFTDTDAERAWSTEGFGWGLFARPESELEVLGDVAGLDTVELGCGSAALSSHLARAGAWAVGVDLTRAQLDTARRCQARFAVSFPLVEAAGEEVPLRGSSFDLVASEHGVGAWCDPGRWLAEAARLLRPGGRLVFLTNSVLAGLCVPEVSGVALDALQRPQRAIRRVEWPGGGVEFHPGHGEWIAMLGSHGFVVDALHELYAPDDAPDHDFYEIVTVDWARRWPPEDLWVAHLAL